MVHYSDAWFMECAGGRSVRQTPHHRTDREVVSVEELLHAADNCWENDSHTDEQKVPRGRDVGGPDSVATSLG